MQWPTYLCFFQTSGICALFLEDFSAGNEKIIVIRIGSRLRELENRGFSKREAFEKPYVQSEKRNKKRGRAAPLECLSLSSPPAAVSDALAVGAAVTAGAAAALRKQPGIAIGRLCEKCDGKCVICDSYVRPCTLVRVCDECNYGSFQGRCVICGGVGISDAYYCKECTQQEKDRDGCPKIVNLGSAKTDLFYEHNYDLLYAFVNVLLREDDIP
ncbi:PHD finger-like domain-containing protein 5B [Nymphaea thermarum]|nr:PHD finger-like domain-containing protein 5B [Nymphaea thermarum]